MCSMKCSSYPGGIIWFEHLKGRAVKLRRKKNSRCLDCPRLRIFMNTAKTFEMFSLFSYFCLQSPYSSLVLAAGFCSSTSYQRNIYSNCKHQVKKNSKRRFLKEYITLRTTQHKKVSFININCNNIQIKP